MAVRLMWSRADSLGAGVLLAAIFGAWQATQLADVLGYSEPTRPPEASRPERRETKARAARSQGAGRELGAAFLSVEPAEASSAPVQAVATFIGDQTPPAPTPEAEALAAEQLSAEMTRLARDLEYTPGLPEPKQQVVRKTPTTWRPPAEAVTSEAPVIEAMAPSSAPVGGGVKVVLRGRNLRVAQVMFGGKAARITGATPQAITVEAPPGAGPVRIAVTNSDGTWAVVEQPFIYQN